jgi:PKD repeat protein
MSSKRIWSWTIATLLAGGSLVFSACSSCESSKTPAPAASPAKAAEKAGAATPAAAAAMPVDELYVDAEAEPDEGPPPLTVKFTSTVEDATGQVTYDWDFGDGSPHSSDANPTHVYQKAGDYVATLHATDSKGIKGETEIDITASEEE